VIDIKGNGTWILGQDQDHVNAGGLDPIQAYKQVYRQHKFK